MPQARKHQPLPWRRDSNEQADQESPAHESDEISDDVADARARYPADVPTHAGANHQVANKADCIPHLCPADGQPNGSYQGTPASVPASSARTHTRTHSGPRTGARAISRAAQH